MESDLAKVILQELFQVIDVHEEACLGDPLELLPEGYPLPVGEGGEIHPVAIEEILPLPGGYHGGYEAARTAAGDDGGHAVGLHQGLDDSDVVHT